MAAQRRASLSKASLISSHTSTASLSDALRNLPKSPSPQANRRKGNSLTKPPRGARLELRFPRAHVSRPRTGWVTGFLQLKYPSSRSPGACLPPPGRPRAAGAPGSQLPAFLCYVARRSGCVLTEGRLLGAARRLRLRAAQPGSGRLPVPADEGPFFSLYGVCGERMLLKVAGSVAKE